MRLIDADELEYSLGCSDRDIYVKECLSEAPSVVIKQPEQRWIPVKEKLPPKKGEYLVTYHPCYWDKVDGEICVGIDCFRGKNSWARVKCQKVIAWMPLPEPYREDGEA